MALAQVVYQISTDHDFANRMRSDPEGALQEKGWWLSKEEMAFLLTVLKREAQEFGRIMHIAETDASPWINQLAETEASPWINQLAETEASPWINSIADKEV